MLVYFCSAKDIVLLVLSFLVKQNILPNRGKKPNLMKGPRGLIKPKTTKVRPDLVGTGSSSMLTVLAPHQQVAHQQHQVVPRDMYCRDSTMNDKSRFLY